jgi:hypothetical protein
MLIGYGGYVCTAAITAQSGSGAAFLTPASALFNGRTGDGASLRWTNGAQTTGSFVEITVTIVSPFGEASPRHGVAAFNNVQGVPANLRTVIDGVTQRLVADSRGQLNSWALPFANGATMVTRLFNDDGTVTPPIAAAGTIGIGGMLVGRLIALPTLVVGSNPSRTLIGIPADNRSGRNQNWPLLRNPYWQVQAQLGLFTRAQAKGGLLSNLPSGGNPATTIDIETLQMLLAQAQVCAICDAPSSSLAASTLSNGIRFDQNFMQTNWMIARPSNIGNLSESASPYWTWNPTFGEAL